MCVPLCVLGTSLLVWWPHTASRDARQLTTIPPVSRAAEPKSTNLMWPVAAMRTFSGFTSLKHKEGRVTPQHLRRGPWDPPVDEAQVVQVVQPGRHLCQVELHALLIEDLRGALHHTQQVPTHVEVHDEVEAEGVLEGILQRGQPRAAAPGHDVPLLLEEGRLHMANTQQTSLAAPYPLPVKGQHSSVPMEGTALPCRQPAHPSHRLA